jgi:hypothetical protein
MLNDQPPLINAGLHNETKVKNVFLSPCASTPRVTSRRMNGEEAGEESASDRVEG